MGSGGAVRREVGKRGFFGQLFLVVFYLFNGLMIWWLLSYWAKVGGSLQVGSEAERAGSAIGVTMATGMILLIWALGAVITGLLAMLTRAPRTYVEIPDSGSQPSRRPCPFCAEPILPAAKICPHCRSEIPPPVEIAPAPSASNTSAGLVVGTAAAMVVAFFLPGMLMGPDKQGSSGSSTATKKATPVVEVTQPEDPLTVAPVTPVIVAPKPDPSEWSARSEKSKIDDSTNVYLSAASIEMVEGRYRDRVRLMLWVRCLEGKTALYIDFGGHYMAGLYDTTKVTYRIDEQAAKTKPFGVSTDNSSLGLWGGHYQAIPFIKSLFGKQKLLVRAAPWKENEITAEFPIAGLEESIAPLREACRW